LELSIGQTVPTPTYWKPHTVLISEGGLYRKIEFFKLKKCYVYNKEMDSCLLNKITDEVNIETIIDCYNMLQKNLQIIEQRLSNFGVHTWRAISQFPLSDDFIRKFQDKVDWDFISGSVPLTENFIEEFQDKINWDSVSKSQNLSEDFIRQCQDKLDWKWLSRYQVLSEDFIR